MLEPAALEDLRRKARANLAKGSRGCEAESLGDLHNLR